MSDLFTGIHADWPDALPPSRGAALARAARVQPTAYARTRNHLEGAVTGLSPYLTHGVLTLREVLTEVLRQEGPLPVGHKLVFEFGWREYFRHVWSHAGDRIMHSLHPGPRADDAYASILPDDIRQARTGVPAIDEAVRTLYATGTLHNHARMWLASYVVHLRHVHWRAGADWMVAQLLDGDLASNHLSWQWVAGTGSHKPYLFNAENVARYAPAHWHSPGTVIDQSYDALDRTARAVSLTDHVSLLINSSSSSDGNAASEPTLYAVPPTSLALRGPDATTAEQLRGREVWLVHAWALRAPPTDLPDSVVVIGVYLRDYHEGWPWPAARWRWVDAAMTAVTPQRWFIDAASLGTVLAGAARVRSVDDPHLTRWLKPIAQLDASPTLFRPVERHCHSFSQWWTRTTRGLHQAEELL